MKFQLILWSIFCKRKLQLQSKRESARSSSAIMILEILDKLNLSIKLIRFDDSYGALLNFLSPIDLIINEQSFSISTWTTFWPFLRPVLTFRGLCFRGSAFSRSSVCGLRVTLIFEVCVFETRSYILASGLVRYLLYIVKFDLGDAFLSHPLSLIESFESCAFLSSNTQSLFRIFTCLFFLKRDFLPVPQHPSLPFPHEKLQ